ncbi:MAG: DUF2461 domain-containing protein [Planctomycetota bacterium]|nr:DUF2461 domain-containing protein [Planctomycetota bacterium]
MTRASAPHFGPELFRFLQNLQRNNQREWFNEHKQDWLAHARDPMLRFVADLALRLPKLSPNFLADPRPVGGSMFRIYRDVRFSKDKSPYKTHLAAHFPHLQYEDVHCPGFYLHLAPGEVFFGAGIWQPDGPSLARIRARIVEDPKAWQKVAGEAALAKAGLRATGESLKRPPRGFDAEHPYIEDLKRKDFCVAVTSDELTACAPDFLDWFVARCRASTPYVKWLCDCLEVPF